MRFFSHLLVVIWIALSNPVLNGQEIKKTMLIRGDSQAPLKPGAEYGGGKIFWIDPEQKHGLVAASTDQSATGMPWNPADSVATGATADGIYAGAANTQKIVAVQGRSLPYAARLCDELVIQTGKEIYDDWYLPSREELNLLFQNRVLLGGFNLTNGLYWSSTETKAAPAIKAWEQEFRYGSQLEDDKDMAGQVRCIRKL